MVQDYTATLTTKTEVASHIWYYTFSLPEGQSIDFVAGQYMLLSIDNNYRQYSIASSDAIHDSFELLVETVPNGLGSNYLMNLPVGQTAQFKGPAGVFVLKDTPRDKILLATGTGIAPIKSMIESYFTREQHNASLTLFFGLRDRSGVYLFNEFKNIAQHHPNFNFRICLSREENLVGLDEMCYGIGRVNTHVDIFMNNHKDIAVKTKDEVLNSYEYYICGSKMTVDSLKEYVLGMGVSAENIAFERFTV